jgi:hypothetical protein
MSSMTLNTSGRRAAATRAAQFAPLALLALLLTLVAERIGAHTVDLGIGTVSLYPLIWGLALGAAVSMQKIRPLPVPLQKTATHLVQLGILLLGARLSFVVGQNIQVLFDAGPALLLQELGHLFGTVLFSLPIAVLLRMGRPTVGACFSIDREGSFAIVGEKYGADSDEYRGVLSMYVFGTLFGALYVSLLASFFAAKDIFDPLALAMGAGVGSGSVMAASSASIAAEHPELAEQIYAMAAVSNLITTMLGLYVGMYVALPLAERFYRFLSGRIEQPEATPATTPDAAAQATQDTADVLATDAARPSLLVAIPVLAAAMLGSTVVFHRDFQPIMLAGFAVMIAVLVTSLVLKRFTGLSPIISLTTIGLLLGCPWSPVATTLNEWLLPIEFLPLTTPVLVLAGLGLGKDLPLLSRIGWRIIPVGMVSFAASFLVAAGIAQLAL